MVHVPQELGNQTDMGFFGGNSFKIITAKLVFKYWSQELLLICIAGWKLGSCEATNITWGGSVGVV